MPTMTTTMIQTSTKTTRKTINKTLPAACKVSDTAHLSQTKFFRQPSIRIPLQFSQFRQKNKACGRVE